MKTFYYSSDYRMCWVSFLDGLQRVLLFTEDESVAVCALQVRVLQLRH